MVKTAHKGLQSSNLPDPLCMPKWATEKLRLEIPTHTHTDRSKFTRMGLGCGESLRSPTGLLRHLKRNGCSSRHFNVLPQLRIAGIKIIMTSLPEIRINMPLFWPRKLRRHSPHITRDTHFEPTKATQQNRMIWPDIINDFNLELLQLRRDRAEILTSACFAGGLRGKAPPLLSYILQVFKPQAGKIPVGTKTWGTVLEKNRSKMMTPNLWERF